MSEAHDPPPGRSGSADETSADETSAERTSAERTSAEASSADGASVNEIASDEISAEIMERSGDSIGPYRLLNRLGEGGMGTVWMAEQREPVRRRVALKIIKLGMDTRQVVARFEAERQALALMDHPHIATVFDGGTTRQGRPYFVMELVQGAPITKFCDAAKSSVPERLELLGKVCSAIQHAHQKGVIHRDIKPSNVLVTWQDGVAVPKVIDFGIAKATSAELTQRTLFTELSQIIGTPEYMAPEQARASGVDIDTRADVYSLGVLLYELLTGMPPLDVRSALQAGYAEMMRCIRDQDPPKPSTRVSTLGAGAEAIAAARRAQDVRSLCRGLRGDLDWIVMKALEKDRGRRYDSPSALAEDLARYARSEVVTAVPPSSVYRFRKLLRRRKAAVLTTVTMLLLMLAGSVGTAVGWWRSVLANRELDVVLQQKGEALDEEKRQRARAERLQGEASEQAERASVAESQAQERAVESERIADFQIGRFEAFSVPAFGTQIRREILNSVPEEEREELQRGLASVDFAFLSSRALEDHLFRPGLGAIDVEFREQPRLRVRLYLATASALMSVSRPTGAEATMRLALLALDEHGIEGPLRWRCQARLADALRLQRRLDEARDVLTALLEGRESPRVEDDPALLEAWKSLALTLAQSERWDRAGQIYDALQEVRLEDPRSTIEEVLSARGNRGTALVAEQRFAEAEAVFRPVLEEARREFGNAHNLTMVATNNLGFALMSLARHAEAEALLREAYETRCDLLGVLSPDTLLSLDNLITLLNQTGRTDESLELSRTNVERHRAAFGERDERTLGAVSLLATLLTDTARFDESLTLSERYLLDEELLRDHPNAAVQLRYARGQSLSSRGRLAEAREALLPLEELDPGQLDLRGVSRRFMGLGVLALVFGRLGDMEEAERLGREAKEGLQSRFGANSPSASGSSGYLCNVLMMKGDFAAAEIEAREARDGTTQAFGRASERIAPMSALLCMTLLQQGKLGEAAREMQLARNALPVDSPNRGLLEPVRLALLQSARSALLPQVQSLRQQAGADPLSLALLLKDHGEVLLLGDSPDDSLEPLEEAIDLFAESLDPEDPRLLHAEVLRGVALQAQGEPAEGEEFLLTGVQLLIDLGEDERLDERALRLLEDALLRTVAFYRQWHEAEPDSGYDEEAALWWSRLLEWDEG